MKLATQQDYMIAGSQYTRGFSDRRSNPSNQPNASGSGGHYYAEGFSDAGVSPAHLLEDYSNKDQSSPNFGKPIFAHLSDEEGDEGKAFVVALRKVAAGVKIDIGDDPKTAIPKLMNALQCAVGQLMESAMQKAQTDRLVKALQDAGIAPKVPFRPDVAAVEAAAKEAVAAKEAAPEPAKTVEGLTDEELLAELQRRTNR